MNFLAHTLSVVFHPLFMVFYAVLIILYPFEHLVISNVQLQWVLLSLIFVFAFVLPLLFILILRYFKIISSLTINKRAQRVFPYAFTASFYFFVWYLFSKISLLEGVPAKAFLFGAIAITILLICNFRLKISAHTLAMSSICGLVLRLVYSYNELHQLELLLLCIFLSGAVASARLYLNAHTWKEIAYGGGIGVILGILGPSILL